MICHKRWSVFLFKKPRRLFLRHNKCFTFENFSNVFTLSSKRETFASQSTSDEMSETSDYTKREKLCQAKVEISQIQHFFPKTISLITSEHFLNSLQHNYHALALLNSES